MANHNTITNNQIPPEALISLYALLDPNELSFHLFSIQLFAFLTLPWTFEKKGQG